MLLLVGCGEQKTVYVAYPTSDPQLQSEEPIALENTEYDGNLRVEDGTLLPMLNYSDLRDSAYSNEYSDILRFCVYVETDYDTDGDGNADLVKALVQVPRGAVEGKYKAGVIYDPTPYGAGTVEANAYGAQDEYLEREFDYSSLYKKGKKRKPEGYMSSMDAALFARPDKDWNYIVPNNGSYGYSYASNYDYYLVRGYAVVEASGIGTYGSEGFELCGMDLERDSHKSVIEWLTGDRIAYTDKTNNIEIKADWSNGNVAMTGCSYGGTLPFEVATSGVKGLKTIIPFAGIASWYNYVNSQGVTIINNANYTDYLSAYNCGGVYLDDDWLVLNENYRSWLWQISSDQYEANGNYDPLWDSMNYAKAFEKINCSALIVQGLNDFNVTTVQAKLMYDAFKKAGQNVKLLFHQDGHNVLYQNMINDELWLEIENKWLAHYLYDVDNGIENMAELTVQSNIDGMFYEYDSFGDTPLSAVNALRQGDIKDITTIGLAEYATEFDGSYQLSMDNQSYYYLGLPESNAAFYDLELPDNATISGTPEVHLRLSTSTTGSDGFMISAILIDVADDGDYFDAYMTKERIGDCLPTHVITEIDRGGGLTPSNIFEFVKSPTPGKCISFGWTDLYNPECGPDSSEYTVVDSLEVGKYYDYTFYMLPTVYTVEKGHTLKLVLTTWDPYRAFLDEGFSMDMSLIDRMELYEYSYVIDNDKLNVELPIIGN